MITCTKNIDKTYTIGGLTVDDLELIKESYALLFGECRREAFRHIRRQVIQIDRAIDPVLEQHYQITEDEQA